MTINDNGVTRYFFAYAITPQRTGEFSIPATTINIGSEKVSTQPLKLTVSKPTAPSEEAVKSGTQVAFLKVKLPKQQVFVGEAFSVEIDIYLRDTIQGVENFQCTALPADDFTVGKLTQKSNGHAERIGNNNFQVIPLVVAMTASKPGDLTIGPVTASLIAQVPLENSRGRDPFNDVQDPFGMFRPISRRQLTLASEAVAVKSLPVPLDKAPSGFNGAVGTFTMSVNVGPTNLTVGDPITIHAQISGQGDLTSLTLPNQDSFKDFKIYPPTSKIETTDLIGIEGSKTFEEVVVPQSAEIHELPTLSFTFFDPELKDFRTLTHPPTPLTVRPAGVNAAPTILAGASASDNAPKAAQDIVPIKQRLGNVLQADEVLVQKKWFVAVQSVPVLAWMTMLVWRKRKDNLENNPRLRRQRTVAKIIENGLNELKALAQENRSEDFFATLFRLLQERLGERLDLPASAITEAVVDERLRGRNIPEATLQALDELFQLCNLARYAPVRGSQELSALIPKLRTTLDEMENADL